MLDERQRKTAERFGLTAKIEKLQSDILKIEYVEDVGFDLSGFYDNLNEVIFLIKFNIPVSAENYYKLLLKMIKEILETAHENDLKQTRDRIEDNGEWLYFVTEYKTERNEKCITCIPKI